MRPAAPISITLRRFFVLPAPAAGSIWFAARARPEKIRRYIGLVQLRGKCF
jgi:hypothetical protein